MPALLFAGTIRKGNMADQPRKRMECVEKIVGPRVDGDFMLGIGAEFQCAGGAGENGHVFLWQYLSRLQGSGANHGANSRQGCRGGKIRSI